MYKSNGVRWFIYAIVCSYVLFKIPIWVFFFNNNKPRISTFIQTTNVNDAKYTHISYFCCQIHKKKKNSAYWNMFWRQQYTIFCNILWLSEQWYNSIIFKTQNWPLSQSWIYRTLISEIHSVNDQKSGFINRKHLVVNSLDVLKFR